MGFLQVMWKKKDTEAAGGIMYIIAGLGNPDKKYVNTRHNVGFDVIDALAEQYNINMNIRKHKAVCGIGTVEGVKALLVKPQTYMNLSGESVAEILAYYKLNAAGHLLVAYDDISLACGNIRIRAKGSAGGHNGIKNIIARTGSDAFARIKIGVGEKPAGWDLADYVLGRFSQAERRLMDGAVADAVTAAGYVVNGGIDRAMNEFNRKNRE